MRFPWAAGRVLKTDEFESYYRRVISDCCHTTIRPKEHLPLIDFPLLMKPGEWPKLARLTEKLSQELFAAERELLRRPELYDLLGMEENIAKVLRGCRVNQRPRSVARVMRFDFCFTREGWRFSEANPDAPGGHLEAVGLTNAMATFYPGYSPPPNPAAAHAKVIRRTMGPGAMVAFFHARPRTLAWLGQFILGEFEKQGMRGISVYLHQLRWHKNRAQFSGPSGILRPNAIVRLVQSRGLPYLRQRSLWVPWFCGSETPLSNPGFTILAESKRFPLVQTELETRMPNYRAFSPESRAPNDVPERSQDQWVFKPAFGSGGGNIGFAGVTQKGAFKRIADQARKNKASWVAQRRFENMPIPTERGPGYVCLGVYTLDGVVAGAFGRIKGKPLIDEHAMSIPVLIPEDDL